LRSRRNLSANSACSAFNRLRALVPGGRRACRGRRDSFNAEGAEAVESSKRSRRNLSPRTRRARRLIVSARSYPAGRRGCRGRREGFNAEGAEAGESSRRSRRNLSANSACSAFNPLIVSARSYLEGAEHAEAAETVLTPRALRPQSSCVLEGISPRTRRARRLTG
jgi:hypothetical protein